MAQIDVWQEQFARKASVFLPDDTFDSGDEACSWFGRITLQERGECWPAINDRPMWPLLQIVIRDLPYRPRALDDLALIRVYINPAYLCRLDNSGGGYYHPERVVGPGWLLRASSTLGEFEPSVEPDHGCTIKPTPGRWELIENDYPTRDDLPPELSNSKVDEYCDLREEGLIVTHDGTKVGGWPYNVQSEIEWEPKPEYPHNPKYVFQVDSDYERGWMWGDTGFGYFGRRMGQFRDEWEMEWQCY